MNQHNPWAGPPPGNPQYSSDAATTAFPAAGAPATDRFQSGPVGMPEAPPPPIMLRRARPSVFIAPEPVDEGQVLAREFSLRRNTDKPKELTRNRKIAGNLPDWDPTPPGEIKVVPRRPNGGS
ncbi:hypothetical protein ACXYX3_05765 [Mycobacterium sp. C3-094]